MFKSTFSVLNVWLSDLTSYVLQCQIEIKRGKKMAYIISQVEEGPSSNLSPLLFHLNLLDSKLNMPEKKTNEFPCI